MIHLFLGFLAVSFLILLAAINGALVRLPLSIEPIMPSSASDRTVSPDGGIDEPRVASRFELNETYARPLFAPLRRPWTEPQAELQPEPPLAPSLTESPAATLEPTAPLPQLILLGIQRTPAGVKALLAAGNGLDASWLLEGQSVEGWTIAQIDRDFIAITLGSARHVISLYPTPQADGNGP
ncbi:MAG: hypothetical protein HC788_04555 [Sphingopyxis sp.]|nr:hypothetical protein [Sphingopyxis sp.]